MNNTVKVEKLGFWEIFQQGLKIFWFKIKDILLISLFTYLPFAILTVSISLNPSPSNIGINNSEFYLFFGLYLIYGVFSLILAMSLAIITEKVVDQKDISWLDAVKDASSKLGGALWTVILTSIIIFGLFLLLVIPSLIYSTYYAFIIPVIALREQFGKGALDYSKKLVEGQWWRVFGIQLGLSLILGIIGLIINLSLGLISNNVYLAIVSNLATYLLSIVFLIMNVVLFLNNDFVYHRRLAQRKELEKLRRAKSVSSVEQNTKEIKKEKAAPAKRSSTKKVVRKTENKITNAKKSRRTK